MASTEELRQRTKDEPAVETTQNHDNNYNHKGRRQRRTAMARRGLRSLAIAVLVPMSLHVAAITLSHSAHGALAKPPSWTLHAICVGLNSLMGFCAWLVWAEGGFHRKPTGLAFFFGYLATSLIWDPIVFGMGLVRTGLFVGLAMLCSLVGCYRVFKDVNPIAADLLKLSMIWAVVVVSLNVKLLMW
ncbi:Translocator protein [Actinidia chinensis var. chinensis]|uniref:Translocator protein n=1 Tax=Actinidia chinensis var. chinensis TaxID=1590841 RepID=A0A2R6PNY6_ACTCC|nr:Translocator protein [Actinidia chinensis var. chinensis]